MTRVYTARRFPVLPGRAAWNAILGPTPEYPSLDQNKTADVVIIGAGFAGLSAARRLLQLDPALRITVLDAFQIAESSAGRNSGFMIDLPHDLTSDDYSGAGDDKAVIRLNRQAIAFGAAAVEEYGINPAFFDRSGKVNGAVSDEAVHHNETYARHLHSLDEPSTLLDARQMHELTGSRHYQAGLFTSGTVTLQPAGYIRGLAAGVAPQVNLHCQSPVIRFEKQGLGWRVLTPKAHVDCSKIILANNGQLESFGIAKGRLMQVFLYASMTPDLSADTLRELGGQPRWGITPSDPMGTTMRRIDSARGGNRIVTRTCSSLLPDMRPTAKHVARAARIQRRKFDQRFPQLAGMKMEYEWAGHLCLTLNGVTYTHEVERGVYAACAQNGLGTARGTLTGIAAAELAMGQPSEIAEHFNNEAQPTRLPPRPLREIGANAIMRWKEWKARDE